MNYNSCLFSLYCKEILQCLHSVMLEENRLGEMGGIFNVTLLVGFVLVLFLSHLTCEINVIVAKSRFLSFWLLKIGSSNSAF